MSRLRSEIEELIAKHAESLKSLDEREKRLVDASGRLIEASSEARRISQRLSDALAKARQELEVAEDIVIPGLTAANKLFQDRWEAESAVYAARRAVAEAPRLVREVE